MHSLVHCRCYRIRGSVDKERGEGEATLVLENSNLKRRTRERDVMETYSPELALVSE